MAGAIAAGVLAAVFWLNSGSGADRIGPLGGGPVNGAECTPARLAVTIAIDDLRNTTTAPIQVEKFALVGARGIRLLGVSLAPVVSAVGYDLLLTGGPYPPSPKDLAASADVHWNARRSLPMTMPPDQPGHSWNLVIGLERTAAVGTVGFYQMQYEWNGQQYTWPGQTAIRLIAGSSCS